MIARLASAAIGVLTLALPAVSLYGQTEVQPARPVQGRVLYEKPPLQPVTELDNQDWRPRITILRRDFPASNSTSASLIPTRWNDNVFRLIPTQWEENVVQLIPTQWDTRGNLVPDSALLQPRGYRLPMIMPAAKDRQ